MGQWGLRSSGEAGVGVHQGQGENGGVDIIGDVCDTVVTGGYYIYVRGGDCK